MKKQRGIIDGPFSDNIYEDNIHGTIIRNYKGDLEKQLYSLFKYLIKVLNDVYNEKMNELKLTSYSNFFKTDKTYKDHILSSIETRVYQDEYEAERLSSYIKIFD